MTLYASLLQAALEEDPDDEDMALASGIATLLRRRAEMMAATRGPRAGSAVTRTRAAMSYDAVLIRMCRKLEISHSFFAGASPEAARASAEEALARRLPALSEDFLTSAESVTDRPPMAAEGSEPGE